MLIDSAFLRSVRPLRDPAVHKGRLGHALLFGGSVGYTGAARLSAMACARSGAGLVTLCVPRSVYPVVAPALPSEIMCRPLADDGNGRFVPEALDQATPLLDRCDAILAGPGLGRSEPLCAFVANLLARTDKPVVIDADGITALVPHIHLQRRCLLVLTPHDGEFARLGGDMSSPDRAATACALAENADAIVVRKGPGTITAWSPRFRSSRAPDDRFHRNSSGGPSLAKGGSGDVLAGLLTGLLAQCAAAPALWPGAAWPDVLAAGVYLHGLAGDLGAKRIGERGFTPSDLVDGLPEAIKQSWEE